MTPVAVRGWNPLAGLAAEALRPLQSETPAVLATLAPVGEGELIELCEHHVALEREWFRIHEEYAELIPQTPRFEVLDAQMDALEAQAVETAADLVGRTAATPAGLLALARTALHAMVANPLCGEIDLDPGDDGVPTCLRRQDNGALALGVIASVLGVLGGQTLRFVNVPAAGISDNDAADADAFGQEVSL